MTNSAKTEATIAKDAPSNGAPGRQTQRKNPKGDPCQFISPPNKLLAKVTHDPKMTEVRSVKKGTFHFDKSRLKKMTSIIEKNQSVCIDTLNRKVKELEPIYEDMRNGTMPDRDTLKAQASNLHSVSKALDHIPVSRITASLLKYLNNLPPSTDLESNLLSPHFDALFNRETLNVKLDPPTKLVLTALEALTDHALAVSK